MTDYPRWAVIGIFIILCVHTMMWAGDFLIPITAAVLAYLIASPIQRRAERLGVPSVVSAMAITLGVAAIIVVAVLRLQGPLAGILDDLPRMFEQISRDVTGGNDTIKKIGEAADAAQKALKGDGADAAIQVEVVAEENYITTLIRSAPALVSQTVFALVLMFFLIASGNMFIVKIVEAFSSFEEKRHAVHVFRQLERKLGLYLGGITAINAGLGLAIGSAMYIWGMPHAVMFGFIGFAFNFVPYLGAIAGAALAAMVAFSEFGDIWPAIGIFSTYMALTSFEGQFVTPYVISNRLRLNTTVVFLSVAFFAWIWSIIGMVVAVPLLIVTKSICDELPGTRTFGNFLGSSTRPEKKRDMTSP